MTRSTRFIAATALAGATALGIGGIAAAQDSDDGDLTVTEVQAPANAAVLAQTDPTTPPDDSTTTEPPAAADDETPDDSTEDRDGDRRGRGGCDEDGESGTDGSGADSTTPAPSTADTTPAPSTAETVPATDPASEA